MDLLIRFQSLIGISVHTAIKLSLLSSDLFVSIPYRDWLLANIALSIC